MARPCPGVFFCYNGNMDEEEFDYHVVDRFTFRLKRTIWDMYPAPTVHEQVHRCLGEYLGISIERDTRTTVFRVNDGVVVHIE